MKKWRKEHPCSRHAPPIEDALFFPPCECQPVNRLFLFLNLESISTLATCITTECCTSWTNLGVAFCCESCLASESPCCKGKGCFRHAGEQAEIRAETEQRWRACKWPWAQKTLLPWAEESMGQICQPTKAKSTQEVSAGAETGSLLQHSTCLCPTIIPAPLLPAVKLNSNLLQTGCL